MELVFVWFMRVLYPILLGINLYLLIKKIIQIVKKDENIIYYASYIYIIFLSLFIIGSIIYVTTDYIKHTMPIDSWKNIIIMFSLFIIYALIPTIINWKLVNYKLKFNDNSFIINYGFKKNKVILFSNIDVKNSKYMFKMGKTKGILKFSTLLKNDEKLKLVLNDGKYIYIGFNNFIYSGNKTKVFLLVVNTLKIERVQI